MTARTLERCTLGMIGADNWLDFRKTHLLSALRAHYAGNGGIELWRHVVPMSCVTT
jgi:hypothetical protein